MRETQSDVVLNYNAMPSAKARLEQHYAAATWFKTMSFHIY